MAFCRGRIDRWMLAMKERFYKEAGMIEFAGALYAATGYPVPWQIPDVPFDEGSVELMFKPFEIKTIRFCNR